MKQLILFNSRHNMHTKLHDKTGLYKILPFFLFLVYGVKANLMNSFLYPLTRLLLKQLVTMEVIQWTALWNTFKDEFENEKNMLGGALGEKAAENLRLRVIEHVMLLKLSIF